MKIIIKKKGNARQTFLFALVCLMLPSQVVFARLNVSIAEDFSSWINLSPAQQLAKEGIDDQKNFGRIFVPAMSQSVTEPFFDVYQKKVLIKKNNPMGKSLFLLPGEYRLQIGNDINGQRPIQKRLYLNSGETKIIYPDWSGLIIRIIEPTRKYLIQSYEIFDMNTKESIGLSISKDESEPDEKPETWILPPGRYKITKAGYPYNTAVNFSTVSMQPGRLYQWTIVMDEYTGNMVGAGHLEEMTKAATQLGNQSIFSSLSGSYNTFQSNRVQENEYNTIHNILLKWDNRFQYDGKIHYLLSEPSYELIMSQEKNQKPIIYADKLIFNNLYIYYLTSYFGFYGRLDLQSKFFVDRITLDSQVATLTLIDKEGNQNNQSNISEFNISPRWYPLYLKEGLGLNITPWRTSRIRLSFRGGIGFRQNIYNDVYEKTSDNDYTYKEIDSLYIRGTEFSARLIARPLDKLLWSLKVDILFPFQDSNNNIYEFENSLSYRILKYISIEHLLSYKRGLGRSYGLLENNFWLKFSYIFYE